MDKLTLPIGQTDFRTIRTSGSYYIDKTGYISQIIRMELHPYNSRVPDVSARPRSSQCSVPSSTSGKTAGISSQGLQ